MISDFASIRVFKKNYYLKVKTELILIFHERFMGCLSSKKLTGSSRPSLITLHALR